MAASKNGKVDKDDTAERRLLRPAAGLLLAMVAAFGFVGVAASDTLSPRAVAAALGSASRSRTWRERGSSCS